MKKISSLIVCLFLIVSCQSRDDLLTSFAEEKEKYDKFEDVYSELKYRNKHLGLTIPFDSDWKIFASFDDFGQFQKKYARYFSSEKGEVLFVGYNDERAIGVRCTCEQLGLTDLEYFEKLKEIGSGDISNYKIKFLEESEIELANIKGYHSVFESLLNDNNVFVFDSVIFSRENNDFKIDFWLKKSLYESQKEYIFSLFDQIDFMIREDGPKPPR